MNSLNCKSGRRPLSKTKSRKKKKKSYQGNNQRSRMNSELNYTNKQNDKLLNIYSFLAK